MAYAKTLDEVSQRYIALLDLHEKLCVDVASFGQWLQYLVQNAPIPSDEAVDLIFQKWSEMFPSSLSSNNTQGEKK